MSIVEDFFEKRVEDPKMLHELFSACAYKLRKPDAKIYKVFMNYSEPLNPARDLLTGILASMFPESDTFTVEHYGLVELYDYYEEEDYKKSLFIFSDPPTKRAFNRIWMLATSDRLYISRILKPQTPVEFTGLVLVNTSHHWEVPDNHGVIINFKPLPLSQADKDRFLGNPKLGQELAEYLKYVYENPYCPELERWDTVHCNKNA